MKLSELIEQYIKELMDEQDGFVEFGRNDLALYFNCVPSQINYVISTRFNPESGYYVESKRGGGGNIKIRRINISNNNYIMHIVNSIPNNLSQHEAELLVANLVDFGLVSEKEAKLLRVAVNDKVLNLPKEYRDVVRTSIFKNMIVNLM